MCGRYSWKKLGKKRFAKLTQNDPKPEHTSFNRAPGQVQPTLSARNGAFEWKAMLWGRPQGRNKGRYGAFPINARSETVGEKPTFRESFENRRCLVPADGFYEWQIVETDKYPHFIHLPDQPTFAMAGIWSRNPGTKENEDAFAILTQSAHPGLLHLHHRMPVILDESSWEEWLDPLSPVSNLRKTLDRPGPEMIAYQVGKRVNSTKNDDPDLQDPSAQRQDLLF
jgi:putative SOS response-associated peptidase YedK